MRLDVRSWLAPLFSEAGRAKKGGGLGDVLPPKEIQDISAARLVLSRLPSLPGSRPVRYAVTGLCQKRKRLQPAFLVWLGLPAPRHSDLGICHLLKFYARVWRLLSDRSCWELQSS